MAAQAAERSGFRVAPAATARALQVVLPKWVLLPFTSAAHHFLKSSTTTFRHFVPATLRTGLETSISTQRHSVAIEDEESAPEDGELRLGVELIATCCSSCPRSSEGKSGPLVGQNGAGMDLGFVPWPVRTLERLLVLWLPRRRESRCRP